MNQFENIKVKDFLVSGELFTLIYDSEKEMLVTTPQPSSASLPSYYNSEDYISHTDKKKGIFAFLYQTVKTYSLKRKVKLISALNNSSGSLLDIGAGTGDFLSVAKQNDWSVSGIEVNEQARNLAHKKGIHLLANIENLGAEKYDVITLWQVLEHISNLDEICVKLESLLNENGCLIIAVPNYNSFDAKYYGAYWAAFDVPRHLWHFSQDAMERIFPKQLKLLKKKPMIFDAYYVSLLSEKYKSGYSFSLKAFWIGLVSNMKAKRTGEYSSLIYCYKKGV